MSDIISQVTVEFQPVVDLLSGRVLGHEALARRAGRESEGFAPLKRAAQRAGKLSAALRRAQRMALENAGTRPGGTTLFLNVNPDLLADLMETSLPEDISWPDLVLEIPESEADFTLWAQRVGAVRSLGAQIAVDDWGVGQADPLRLLRLEPDWIKVDRAIVSAVGHDPAADRLIELLVHWTAPSSVRIIAEGIEYPAQALTLRRLGIRYGQGFGLARPSPSWVTTVDVPEPGGNRLGDIHNMPLAQAMAESLTDRRLALLDNHQALISAAIQQAITHLTRWISLAPLTAVINSPDILIRIQSAIRARLLRILRGNLDNSDVKAAEHLAAVHQKWGVTLAWYVMAHREIGAALAGHLRSHGEHLLAEVVRDVLAWDLGEVMEATQRLLALDAVTGVLTRGAFWARANHELSLARGHGRVLCLSVLAFDGLEAITRTHGQQASDRALAEIGRTLSGWLPRGVLVGYMGGTTFTALLEGPPTYARRYVTAALRAITADNPLVVGRSGLAVSTDHDTVQMLYAHADQRAARPYSARSPASR